jgi:predicted TIM-barrel fold metal-dependent hydrolase
MIMRKILLGLLASLPTLAAWAEGEYTGVDIGERRVAVVDLHLHTGEWSLMPPGFHERLSERVPTGFKWTMAPFADWMLTTGNILSQLDSAGIYGGGLFALYSPHTTGNAPNEFVAQRVAESEGRLWGFASIQVDDWNNESAAQLAAFEQTFADHPEMAGIKLAHAHQQFRFDDERFYPIYEIAGRLGKPMYLHTGTSPNPGTRYEPEYADPAYLEEAIQKFPDAVFILGHTGYDSKDKALTYTDSAIRLAQQYDNVYMEPGALGATRAEALIDDFVVRLKEGNVLHKVIYGSDGVQFPGYVTSHLENYIAAMQRNGYTAEEMEMVLAGNFARVFNIELPQPANIQGEQP